ncbi:MAG: 50S ribosomal protein L18e [Nanoarchaeota archaeon]|nr:50S ribosomal protein L18e [Nanoarchaeota archaeon]MBU1445223.1 50S ribosomal protein L18e [Nanoarchaeota archaeon]MBU2406621.1 50S ribosomal protein L18e [Nanoarchaeota archaeon]MBU2420458.1 50S ribosomal protein L18e [Nanoarchaeota archaeon]MBU2475760.1 50S ribosomal protein L18e [Nanoarchaeota archaeon]
MKTNTNLIELIKELKTLSIKNKVGIWKAIAKELEKSTRRKRAVNLSKIDKVANDKEIIVVPGKVLGNGELKKDITIAAYEFSESANQKIKNKLTIKELMSKDPKKIRIIG